MLNRMQTRYAGLPVRFLLIPVNLFGGQEPKANKDIKAFAEQSVHLATAGKGGNVVMLAKSNLNGVKCTTAGADACSPESTECCPENDAVYDYLLANTPPGIIAWNFDKIVTGTDGKPFPGEQVTHGGALDDALSAVITKLLAEREALAAQRTEGEAGALRTSAAVFAAALCAAAALLVWGVIGARAWSPRCDEEEAGTPYVAVE